MNNKGESKEGFIIDDQHPYAGLFAFREEDRDYFFGREREINVLAKLIDKKVLTVLFGKSGVGKTSLLRAGLIPRLRSNYYLPIFFRINFNDREKPAIIQVKETIESAINQVDPPAVPFADKTLWEYFSTVKIFKGVVKPILVFDQFEEIFHPYDKNRPNVDAFVTEIADLIENRVPVTVQERLKREKKKLDPLDQAFSLRVIFSLREDYLPQLESLYHYIPSVRYSRFRVSQMKGIDAIEAVIKPAKKILKDREVAKEIIKKIPGAKDPDYKPFETIDLSWETRKIEPFLLSLFCYQVNQKRLDRYGDEAEISMELIQEVNARDIINDFYEENISRFKPNVRIAIEDLLLTDKGFRKLQEKNSLKVDGGVTDENIEKLVNRRIIRKETRSGIDYVELIHDVLAPTLKESRDKRKEEEEERKKREKESREKEEAKKKRRKWQIIIALALLVIAIIVSLIGVNLYQDVKIEMQKQKAEEEKQKAEEEKKKRLAYEWAAYSIDVQKKDRYLSFHLAARAYNKQKTNLVARRALLSVFYDGGFYKEFFEDKESEFSKFICNELAFFATFSRDGKQILTVNSTQAILWNWNGKDFTDKRTAHPPKGEGKLKFTPNASFSSDGNYIVFCTDNDEKVILWNLTQNILTPLKLEGGVWWVDFSPAKNSLNILTASRNKDTRLFDLNGKLIRVFAEQVDDIQGKPVEYAAFSPDGKFIISASWDKTIRLWNLDGMLIGKLFKDDMDVANSVIFSPDGQYVVAAGNNGSVLLWNLKTNKDRKLVDHEKEATSAVFSPDGQYILSGGQDGRIRLLSLNNFMVYEFKSMNNDAVESLSFSPDGKYILIASKKGPAQLRLVDPGEIIDIVNLKGNVRDLSEDEIATYNLNPGSQVQVPGDKSSH